MDDFLIPRETAIAMTVCAFLFDLGNIFLDAISLALLSPLTEICAVLFFSIWFSHNGASLWSGSRVGGTMLAMLVDAIPAGNLTFPWTIRVATAAFTARGEGASGGGETPSLWRL